MTKEAPCHGKTSGKATSTCCPYNCIHSYSPLRPRPGFVFRVKPETFQTGFRGTGSFQKVVPGKLNMSQTPLNFPDGMGTLIPLQMQLRCNSVPFGKW